MALKKEFCDEWLQKVLCILVLFSMLDIHVMKIK